MIISLTLFILACMFLGWVLLTLFGTKSPERERYLKQKKAQEKWLDAHQDIIEEMSRNHKISIASAREELRYCRECPQIYRFSLE